MAEQVVTQTQHQQPPSTSAELKKNVSFPDFSSPGAGLSRERSFVRSNPSMQQQINKRRSLAFGQQPNFGQQQMRGKPALEIYRPPSKYFI